MPRAVWDALTGWFDRITLVQGLIQEYEHLISRLDNDINGIIAKRDYLRDDRMEMRDQFRSYTDGTGEVSEIYYESVDNNRQRFSITHDDLVEEVSALRIIRNDADNKLGQLRLLHQIELTQERAFTHNEIEARLN